MAKIIILGSSSEFPFPRTVSNRFDDYSDIKHYPERFDLHNDSICSDAIKGGGSRRTRACMALILKEGAILFDTGPDIKYQLIKNRVDPDAVFLCHEHKDASAGIRHLQDIRLFSEKTGSARAGRKINLFGAEFIPFRVEHSKTAPFLGYKVRLSGRGGKTKTFAYIPDMASIAGIKKHVEGCDILFADGSSFTRNLPNHLSIVKQLAYYKKWGIKRVIFTHIGHGTFPHKKLSTAVKEIYKNAEVAYDGMNILL